MTYALSVRTTFTILVRYSFGQQTRQVMPTQVRCQRPRLGEAGGHGSTTFSLVATRSGQPTPVR